MAKKNIKLILLLVFAFLFSMSSLIFSIWIYSNDLGAKLSAHLSSEISVGLFVEASSNYCGDNLCNGDETCSTCSTDCGSCASTSGGGGGSGSSGGGSSSVSRTTDFTIDKEIFNIEIVTGQSQTNEVIIKNIGDNPIDIKIEVIGLKEYLSLNFNSLYLVKDQSIPLSFTIHAPKEGIYSGKIILTYQGIKKEVLIMLNVLSERVLFDTTVTVPDLYRVLRVGQSLPALIEITELGGEREVNVTMNYIIKDFEDNTYYTESETFTVYGSRNYNKRFSTKDLESGNYILGVELVYVGGFATSTVYFRISDSLITPQTWLTIGIWTFLMIITLITIFFLRRRHQKHFKLKHGID